MSQSTLPESRKAYKAVAAAVNDAYLPGVPPDQQSGCIEAFFDPEAAEWVDAGFPELAGTDEESQAMMQHALSNWELSPEVRDMIRSWQTDGF